MADQPALPQAQRSQGFGQPLPVPLELGPSPEIVDVYSPNLILRSFCVDYTTILRIRRTINTAQYAAIMVLNLRTYLPPDP